MLHNTSNQRSKFRTKNWVDINDEQRGTYNTNNQIKFKTTMLKSSLCDYSYAYILVKGKITITRIAGSEPDTNNLRSAAQLLAARQADDKNKGVIFENCTPFIN